MTESLHEQAFRQLFEPFTIERFFAERWPSRFFFDEPRDQRLTALELLLGRSDIDSLLAAHEPVGIANVFAERDGTMVVETVPPLQARERAPSGSILLKKMHRALPSIGACVRMIEDICGLSADACDSHIHISTPGAGFMTHLDDKDILMLQLRGTKAWWVSEAPFIEAPTDAYVPGEKPSQELTAYWPSDMPLDGSFQPPDSDLRRIDLTPGSMLFIPRGYLHRTKALDESVSVTFGFHTRSWAELVTEKLKRKLIADVNWRRPVQGVAPSTNGSRSVAARAEIEPLLHKLVAAARDLESDELVELPAPSSAGA